ncbi:DUF2332 domain-containing protein [Salinibacterium sp. SYSU T00001]|uniref:DUF2332 domain-containing protein n=1 Tax=Homoserinimonas sedimenticola TaxID=2986805 RepID=UPI002235DBF4|nr:DUF2332 domain-containing protein [Salinibacterium sedimenticola]MCW4386141.1 DUF2332 domain-containing protein [Salinibacterium sedimenticola]
MPRDTAQWFRAFAAQTLGTSALYGEWAAAVAADAATLALLERLPEQQRQPPLVFAVASLLGARQHPDDLLGFLREHEAELARELAERPMQTNEPNRCAALLPALERIEGPIALLELGASAGLCLYPDRYSYDYSGRLLHPADGPSPVRLTCALGPGVPAPTRLPEVVWRGGIDLRPLDVADDADAAWLDVLAWPGQHDRRDRVRAASDVVREHPPVLLAGDAEARLEELLALAPASATPVIVTAGMLVYVPAAQRARLIERVRRSGARWVSLEGAGVVPAIAQQLVDAGETREGLRGRFVVALDEHPLAWCGPYGESLEACPSGSGA